MAPEMLKLKKYDDKVDVWSATIVVFILLQGSLPYVGQDFKDVANQIENSNPISNIRQGSISEDAEDFLTLGL